MYAQEMRHVGAHQGGREERGPAGCEDVFRSEGRTQRIVL